MINAGARLTLVLAVAGLVHAPGRTPSVTPPEQPASGPGSRAYLHEEVRSTRFGTGEREVYVFEPASPTPAIAPVVVFGHGWAAMDPEHYGAWITHIVRRGNTVIYPRYQANLRTPVAEFTSHAVAATARALQLLRQPGHATPDARGVVFVGHSMGGLVVTNLAIRAAKGELPPPLALMVVAPGKTLPEASPIAFRLEDLSHLPPQLLLLSVVGDDDDFVRDVDARKIYTGAVGVEPANKNFVRVFSDDHGSPPLVADHRFAAAPPGASGESESRRPTAAGEALDRLRGSLLTPDRTAPRLAVPSSRGPVVTDALDFFGTWKLLDGLVDAVFRGVHREYALGDTPEQRYMGHWSDGVPVRELIVETP